MFVGTCYKYLPPFSIVFVLVFLVLMFVVHRDLKASISVIVAIELYNKLVLISITQVKIVYFKMFE